MTITDKYMNLTVTNRSGEREPYDVNRIKEVIQWATNGLNKINPLELESKFHQRITDGIETDTIQNHLVQCAIELCDKYYPDWRYVAGRLKMWSRWRNCLAMSGVTYDDPTSILTYIQDQLGINRYTNVLYRYSAKNLTEAIKWIDPNADLDYDYAGVELLEKRYLYDDELPQVNFLVNALILALPEPEPERLVFAKRIYQYLAERKISLATPMLANLRVPSGSVTSCFITAMDDNLESIFDEIKNIARISKNGGGVGINVSNIRATNSEVMGRTNASGGVVPWIKIINDTAIAVNQGGRRAGAATVALDSWHLDVEEFLEIQTENGDQRRKAYDIFPQLVVTDEFMRRVKSRTDWYLVCPYQVKQQYKVNIAELWGKSFESFYAKVEADIISGKYQGNYKRINANALFKQAMKSQTETGLPYITFKCTVNKANPNKHDGYIPNTNLCVESFSNVKAGKLAHCCNLVSLNLANINDYELPSVCSTATRLLDNSIEMTTPPFSEAKAHNERYRTIGVGTMGLADWLAKNHLLYTDMIKPDYRALATVGALFEEIAYWCTRESMVLAKERGYYPAYPGSEWHQGKLLGSKDLEDIKFRAVDATRWEELADNIQKYGIRNSHIMAIAPNTSSSLVQGCTASILPTYSRFHVDKWSNGLVPVAPPFLEEAFHYYQENKQVPQQNIVRMVSTIQFWVDTGISMELIFNPNEGAYSEGSTLSPKDMYDVYMSAWQLGCKAIYYVRVIQKDSLAEEIQLPKKECSVCAN